MILQPKLRQAGIHGADIEHQLQSRFLIGYERDDDGGLSGDLGILRFHHITDFGATCLLQEGRAGHAADQRPEAVNCRNVHVQR